MEWLIVITVVVFIAWRVNKDHDETVEDVDYYFSKCTFCDRVGCTDKPWRCSK